MAAIISLKKYEPVPRFYHMSVQVGRKVLVYGGRTQRFSTENRRRLASVVEVFDPYRGVWESKQTKGEPPIPGLAGAATASVKDTLFMYGGWDVNDIATKSFHQLDTKSYHWCKLDPHNAKESSPMAKYGAAMIACGDTLALFGGHGVPHCPNQPGSSFLEDSRYRNIDSRGLTNEFHIYHLTKGMHVCNTS